MEVIFLIVVVSAAWLVLAITGAVLIGRVIHRRDHPDERGHGVNGDSDSLESRAAQAAERTRAA